MPADTTETPVAGEQDQSVLGRSTKIARMVAGLNPQGMNNLILFGLGAMLAILIYVDRRDRQEQNSRERVDRMEQVSLLLRHNESQAELNRQSIASQTQSLQALSTQIGKLGRTVTELDRTVGSFPKSKGPPGPGIP